MSNEEQDDTIDAIAGRTAVGMSVGIGIGVALGAGVGILLDNPVTGIAAGLALGAGVGGSLNALRRPRRTEM